MKTEEEKLKEAFLGFRENIEKGYPTTLIWAGGYLSLSSPAQFKDAWVCNFIFDPRKLAP